MKNNIQKSVSSNGIRHLNAPKGMGIIAHLFFVSTLSGFVSFMPFIITDKNSIPNFDIPSTLIQCDDYAIV